MLTLKQLKRRGIFLFLFAFTLLAFLPQSFAKGKVSILYSDTGSGHDSTQKILVAQMKLKYPDAEIVAKNIWDFTPDFVYGMKKLGWKSALSYFPKLRDAGYRSAMADGLSVDDLKDATKYHWAFPKDKVLDWIKSQDPDTVLAVNYSGAEILRVLRQKGKLKNINMGWVVTDYSKGYWPRVSKYLDKTFLSHPALLQYWHEQGVPYEKLELSGIPVDPKLFEPYDKAAILKTLPVELDPNMKTVFISGGGDGAAPFSQIVLDLAKSPTPLQIVVACGRNTAQLAKLMALKSQLPPQIRLYPLGFTKQLPDFVRVADVYIAKAGGISSTEGFVIGNPMVVYFMTGGGVEIENINFFKEQNIAAATEDVTRVGSETLKLLSNQALQESNRKSLAQTRSFMDISPILQFAYKEKPAETMSIAPATPPTPQKGMWLIDEKEALAARVHLALHAKNSLKYTMFLQRADDVGLLQLALLRQASRNGVKDVRAVLDDQGARLISKGMLRHLRDVGVDIRIYHKRRLSDLKNFHRRLHDKFISADENAFIVGGRNAQNSYFGVTPDKNRMNYDDMEVYLEGSDAKDTTLYFNTLWTSNEVEEIAGLDMVPVSELIKAQKILDDAISPQKLAELIGETDQQFAAKLQPVESFTFGYDPLGTDDKVKGVATDLIKFINEAKFEIVILTPYLILTPEFEEALSAGRARGVKIKIVTNSFQSNDNPFVQTAYRNGLPWFEARGIEVLEYNGPNNFHYKIAYIDGGAKVSIGSFNMDPRSQNFNTEIVAIVSDPNFGKKLPEFVAGLKSKTHSAFAPQIPSLKRSILCNSLVERMVDIPKVRNFF